MEEIWGINGKSPLPHSLNTFARFPLPQISPIDAPYKSPEFGACNNHSYLARNQNIG